jgi:Ni,Fe-hydrogenase III large subunit
MHAHCGVLRERVLRAADACFRHRLMMDRIVPGGVTADLDAAGAARLRELVAAIRRSFPELVELYDNTASLQDRRVATGRVAPELVRWFAAGGHVGRAAGRRS